MAIAITEKNSVAPMRTGRRPILSATMLKTSEPISTPKLAAAKTPPSTDRAHAPVLDDGRRDVAHGLHVEAVHDQADHAEDEDSDLEWPDPALLEQLTDVDLAGRRLGHRVLLRVGRLKAAPTELPYQTLRNQTRGSILACQL